MYVYIYILNKRLWSYMRDLWTRIFLTVGTPQEQRTDVVKPDPLWPWKTTIFLLKHMESVILTYFDPFPGSPSLTDTYLQCHLCLICSPLLLIPFRSIKLAGKATVCGLPSWRPNMRPLNSPINAVILVMGWKLWHHRFFGVKIQLLWCSPGVQAFDPSPYFAYPSPNHNFRLVKQPFLQLNLW